MNAYDFDQTIFQPDSSYAFLMYCLRHYTRAVLYAAPGMLYAAALRLVGAMDTRQLKEKVFGFLPYLEDVDRIVEEFWAEKEAGLEPWYLLQKREDDLIISASPDFLLRPIADKLGVQLIATPMDRHSGLILGKNCHDYEKVTRFIREYPHEKPERFYSDSLSDSPMAWYSHRAYLVDKGKLSSWPERKSRGITK